MNDTSFDAAAEWPPRIMIEDPPEPDGFRWVDWIVGFVLAVILVGLVWIVVANPAAAAAPDMSFGATVIGAEAHPVLKTLLNVGWWTLKVAIVGGLMMYGLSRRKVRAWLTASEYDEAVALRRRYVGDGGEAVDSKAKMSTGEAVYIVGIVSLDKLVAIVLTVLAVTAGAGI